MSCLCTTRMRQRKNVLPTVYAHVTMKIVLEERCLHTRKFTKDMVPNAYPPCFIMKIWINLLLSYIHAYVVKNVFYHRTRDTPLAVLFKSFLPCLVLCHAWHEEMKDIITPLFSCHTIIIVLFIIRHINIYARSQYATIILAMSEPTTTPRH